MLAAPAPSSRSCWTVLVPSLRLALPTACSALLALAPLSAQAFDGWPDLSSPTPVVEPTPLDVAVVVGIENYDHLLDVPGATRNAADWAGWFENTRQLPAEQLWLLQEQEATPDAMAKALAEAALAVGPGARLWFVFVGQAAPSCDGHDVLMLANDAGPGPAGFYLGSLTLSTLQTLVDMGSQDRSVLVIDASINERDRSMDKLACEVLPVMPPTELTPDDRTILLTGSDPDEFAGLLYGADRPAFSYLLLGALRGWGDEDGDGSVTTAEAMGYAHQLMHSTERWRPQTPELWGAGGDTVLAAAREQAPELARMLRNVAQLVVNERSTRLREAEQTLLADAARAWTDLEERGRKPEALAAYLARYEGAIASAAGLRRWAQVPELEQAREALGSVVQRAQPPEPEDAASAHDQITSEMRHLSRRNAWRGVERAFLDLQDLESQGAIPTLEDLSLAAQAARALGKVDQVYERLERMASLQPQAETFQWLNELEVSYGLVQLRNRSGAPAPLVAARMPMAPDQRAVIHAAMEQVEAESAYAGRLPWGIYTFGTEILMVVPGEPLLKVELRKERRER